MTQTDYKVVFTALGFLAVILRAAPQDGRARRAAALADLIESFCKNAMPEAFARQTGERS